MISNTASTCLLILIAPFVVGTTTRGCQRCFFLCVRHSKGFYFLFYPICQVCCNEVERKTTVCTMLGSFLLKKTEFERPLQRDVAFSWVTVQVWRSVFLNMPGNTLLFPMTHNYLSLTDKTGLSKTENVTTDGKTELGGYPIMTVHQVVIMAVW